MVVKYPAISTSLLRPGDVLLYSGTGFWAWAIKIKTWSPVSHCEGYLGAGRTVASREGSGVGIYPLRTERVYAVLRPRHPFDLDRAMAWFDVVCDQGYDWLGLLNFFIARFRGRKNRQMFCSEFLTRWVREGRAPFAIGYDADAVSPKMFLGSPAFRVVVKAR